MTSRVDISQWRDHTEEPVIVWVYTGVWELMPVAVDQVGPEADEYAQIVRAWYAAGYCYTLEELKDEYQGRLTPAEIEALYSAGDGSAEAAGLPTSFVATGVEDDGSDAIIYVDEVTEAETHRETLEEAARYLYPEDLAEIRAEIEKARAEYDC